MRGEVGEGDERMIRCKIWRVFDESVSRACAINSVNNYSHNTSQTQSTFYCACRQLFFLRIIDVENSERYGCRKVVNEVKKEGGGSV